MVIVEGRFLLEGFAADGAVKVHEGACLLIEDGRVAAIGAFDEMIARAPLARRL